MLSIKRSLHLVYFLSAFLSVSVFSQEHAYAWCDGNMWNNNENVYILESGDGSSDFFKSAHEVALVDEKWCAEGKGSCPMLLMKINDRLDSVDYTHVALSSRVTETISDQMCSNGIASVVVSLVNFGSDGGVVVQFQAGMTVIRRVNDSRF